MMKASVSLLLLLCFIGTLQAREASSPLPKLEEWTNSTVSDADAQYACELIVKSENSPPSPRSYTVTARVRNIGSSAGTIMSAAVGLDSGLYLPSGQSAMIQMGILLQPGDTTAAVSWVVRAVAHVAPARLGIDVTFMDISGNPIVCRDSIDIPADPKVELTLDCSADPTELVPDPLHGGYVQDSVEIRLRISNTGDLTVFDLDVAAITLGASLKIAADPNPRRISRLDPGTPEVEVIWWLIAIPQKTDDSACVLILLTGDDANGGKIPTHECRLCIWIPKTSDVTRVQQPPLVEEIILEQNRPNPFSPVTAIDYTLPRESHVRITVHDLLGRCVATPADERVTAGRHSVRFSGSGLPAGVYIYRLECNGNSVVRRMVLLR